MFLKPIFDKIVSFIGLLLIWPVLLVIALLVRVKIGKPVFFVQERIGKDGNHFGIHKFHTMEDGLDESPVSIAGEERITPFGAKLRHYKLDDVPGYADKLQGNDRDVLKLRPGITGPASLKYRNEEELIADYVRQAQAQGDSRSERDIALWYNDNVLWPDKVRINCYYYRNYSFVKDIQMIFCTVLGKKMEYGGEVI